MEDEALRRWFDGVLLLLIQRPARDYHPKHGWQVLAEEMIRQGVELERKLDAYERATRWPGVESVLEAGRPPQEPPERPQAGAGDA